MGNANTKKEKAMTLRLPLKKQWYEMIDSGVKTEEYRDLTPYWQKRFMECCGRFPFFCGKDCGHCFVHLGKFKPYDTVTFSYGYTEKTMTFSLDSISIGKGKSEWGAEADKKYYVLKLGERISEDERLD